MVIFYRKARLRSMGYGKTAASKTSIPRSVTQLPVPHLTLNVAMFRMIALAAFYGRERLGGEGQGT
jgi:hypothetical protein